jgi:hypothetical protein
MTIKQFRRLRDLTKLTLHATDGAVGHAQELYFDDRNWMVRYFVLRTGGWLLGRDVLITPQAVRKIDDTAQTMELALNKKQIEQAPPIDRAKPISRDYEEAYYRYFNWAPYWQPGPGALGGAVPFPAVPPSNAAAQVMAETQEQRSLRSSKEVAGYRIHASDGDIGHVEDLVIDDHEWLVHYVEVDTRNWLPAKKVLVGTARIDQISWADESVAVSLPKKAIESAPAYDPSILITPDYELELFKHYGSAR